METNASSTLLTLTLEQVRDAILAHLKEGNAGHYNIGRLYNYVVDNKLAEQKKYDSAQVYFNQHIQEISQSTLTRYGAVCPASITFSPWRQLHFPIGLMF